VIPGSHGSSCTIVVDTATAQPRRRVGLVAALTRQLGWREKSAPAVCAFICVYWVSPATWHNLAGSEAGVDAAACLGARGAAASFLSIVPSSGLNLAAVGHSW
jgi:hypothetical protein